MISLELFFKEVKSNFKLFIIFFSVLAMYVVMIVPMFDPAMAENLKKFEELMPEIMSAVGMMVLGDDLVSFLTSYLFGFLFMVFPMIYTIMLVNRLVTRYLDNGSMAFLLSTPNSRLKIISTQIVFALLSIFGLIMSMFVIGAITSEITFSNELDIMLYFKLHIALYGLHVMIAGIVFLAACFFSDTRQSILIGSGIIIVMYLIKMIANVSEKFEVMKYFSIFFLFDDVGLLASSNDAWLKILVLYILGLILLILAVLVFKKRNLSI